MFKKRTRQEKFDAKDDPTPRDSFWEIISRRIDSLSPTKRKVVWIGLAAASIATIVATIAFAAVQIGRAPSDFDESAVKATGIETESTTEGDDVTKKVVGAGQVFGIEAWTFLSSSETVERLKADIHTACVSEGMSQGSFVYIIGSWEAKEDGYIGWLKTSPEGAYYRALIAVPGFTVTLEPIDASEAPSVEVPPEEENSVAESEEGIAPSTQEPLSEDMEAPEATLDTRDLGNAVALSDVEGLKAFLPPAAVDNVDALIGGIATEYGFSANPQLSKVFPETASSSEKGCSFTLICMDADRNSLLLEIDYDTSSNSYAGQRLKA